MRQIAGSDGLGLIASAAVLLLAALGACRGQVDAQEARQDARQDTIIRLDSVEVFRVVLRSPVERPNAAGEPRTWEQAFMVRLAVPAPPAMGPKAEIFLDEERVPEYGGWEGGIYFWVYDPARLEALRGRTISYQFDRTPRREIGMLEFGDPQTFRQVQEEELRGEPR